MKRVLCLRAILLATALLRGSLAWAQGGPPFLVVTDVDMPRIDGIELVSLIKKDPLPKSRPVTIVSYT